MLPQRAEATLSIELECDECHRKPRNKVDVFLMMAPKVDTDIPFYLCAACWLKDEKRFEGRIVEQASARGTETHPTRQRE